MLCRLQEADRLPYGAFAFQRWQVGKLQCHPHAVLLRGVHSGHQPQVFQHIERECLMDGTRVYGNETADTLYNRFFISALEIIRKWSLLYLFLSCRPQRLRCRADTGSRCACLNASGIITAHLVLYGLQSPFADAAFLNRVLHGEVSVPVLLRAEAVLYGHLDNLPDDNGTAHPLGVPCLGMPGLPADHVHHGLEALAVIQPAQYKRGGQGHAAFSQALSENVFHSAPECGRRRGCVFFPLFPVKFHDLPRHRVLLEMEVYVSKAVRAVVTP